VAVVIIALQAAETRCLQLVPSEIGRSFTNRTPPYEQRWRRSVTKIRKDPDSTSSAGGNAGLSGVRNSTKPTTLQGALHGGGFPLLFRLDRLRNPRKMCAELEGRKDEDSIILDI
jgi:hypothetical protein